MQEELHVTPQEHSDFLQSTAVLWWLECELDFWLGELSPSPTKCSGLSGPYPPFTWQRYRMLKPWVLLRVFSTRIFKMLIKGNLPPGAEGHSTEDEIYRVFPTAPLAPVQERTLPVSQLQHLDV